MTQFPLTNYPKRTNESFRRRSQRRYHKGLLPILKIKPALNMIFIFVLEYVHLFCEEMMKRLLFFWFIVGGQNNVGQQVKKGVSRRIRMIRRCIHIGFQRKIQTLKALKKWKATEFRFFFLYCGPIVLFNQLNAMKYKKFLLLHIACRLLYSFEISENNEEHAKDYLKRLFESLERLYSKMQVLNMHCAIYVVDDVITTGSNFSGISLFPFENFLGKLKGLLRSGKRPSAQICRRLHELDQIDPPKPRKPFKIEIL